MRTLSLPAGILAAALVWAGSACSDPVSPEPAALVEDPLILSEVVETADVRTVYVSLRAGTVPGGISAKATNVQTGRSVEAPMVDGGLDPVTLPASEGDSVALETRDRVGGLRQFGGTVSLKYPPVVVRSGPMRGATDVGLNSLVIVVFSEPVDERTVSPETIELTLDGEPVPIGVTPSSDGLRAEVDPGGLLPAREYTLVVGRGIRDREGLNLREEYRSTFSTVNAPSVASIAIRADSLEVEVGLPLKLTLTVRDKAGAVLTGRRVTWMVEGPATVGPGDTARMMAPGEAKVIAQAEGVSASLTLHARPLRFRQVGSGDNHTCAVTEVGFAYCWGGNALGQLGVGDTARRLVPSAVNGGLRVRAVYSGAAFTCALNSGDSGHCWGARQERYYLGPDTAGAAPEPLELDIRYQEISLGRQEGCGIERSGITLCWGYFWDDPIDPGSFDGEYGMETFPVAIPTPPLTSLTTGDRHSCGIAPSGAAICWGTNTLGELGDGTVRNTRVLVETDTAFFFDPQTTTVDTDIPFRLIAAGSRHTCALDTGGGAHCWGNNRDGELGTGPANECFWSDLQGPYDCRTRPAPVLGGLVFESLSAGSGFTCGVSPQGAAYCWGRNSRGQLGNGSRAAAPAPAPVAGGLRFTQISAGTDHACGLTDAGLLYCWGRGVEGQLGTGHTADALAPVLVAMQADAAAIAAGSRR